ncbi:MAG: transcriptional regulator [Desulfovibrio sp.]|nr:transcriptional regulator [Desulfovibrio sp.]
MLRIILILAAIYVLYKLIANDWFKRLKQRDKEEKEEVDRKVAAGEMAKDPECGVYVPIDQSISARDGDQIYYFCGYDCRDKFLRRLENGRKILDDGEK